MGTKTDGHGHRDGGIGTQRRGTLTKRRGETNTDTQGAGNGDGGTGTQSQSDADPETKRHGHREEGALTQRRRCTDTAAVIPERETTGHGHRD